MRIRLLPVSALVAVIAACARDDRPPAPEKLAIALTPVADLRGGETVNLGNEPRGTLVPIPGGGWLYAGYQETWTWAEFDRTGTLLRAPGQRGPGGPGEFSEVRAAFPLGGDTLIVLSAGRVTRVLRDGTYIDQQILPFRPGRWAFHQGEFWVSGYEGPGQGVPLMRISRSGELTVLNPLPGTANPENQSPSGYPVSWNGALWLWVYPRGPLHRIDVGSGQAVEEWIPQITVDASGAESWRAFPAARGDTLVFRVDPTFQWSVFDASRAEILSQPIPEDLRNVYPLDSRYMEGWTLDAEEPKGFIRTVRVYEYRLRE